MSAQFHIIADQRAAVHCAELLRHEAPVADPLASLTAVAQAIGTGFARQLHGVIGGLMPELMVHRARNAKAAALFDQIGPSAGNILITLEGTAGPILASMPLSPLLGSLETLFGGNGLALRVDSTGSGHALPRSLELLVGRLGKGLHGILASYVAPESRNAIAQPRISADIRALAPFPARVELLVVDLEFTPQRGSPIIVQLVCRQKAVDWLVSQRNDRSGEDAAQPAAMALSAAPFQDIPLPLRARLVDMAMPVRRLAALNVGDIVPIAVARRIPLMIGNRTIAFGAIGEADDRCALQIETTLLEGVGA